MASRNPFFSTTVSDPAIKAGFFSREALLICLLVVVAVSGLLLRILGGGSYDLAGDDFFTFHDALEDPLGRGLFSGYYLLTRASLFIFGENILGLRLPALAFGILAIPVFYWRVRTNFGQAVAVFGLAIFAFNSWHVEMTFEARYYSGIFLFGLLCMSYFLEFAHSGRLIHLGWSLLSGVVACLFHFTGVLLFAVIGAFSVIALLFPSLVPNRQARNALILLVTAMTLGGLIAVPVVILPLLDKWAGMTAWGVGGWAMVPLLAFNHLSLPVFGAVGFGIISLWYQPNRRLEWLLITIGILAGLFIPTIMGLAMNMSPRYIFVLMPLFFMSAGVFCADIFERLYHRDRFIAVAPCLLLIAAGLPSTISHHIEKRNLSETSLSQYVVDNAGERDILVGNFGSPLVDFSSLEKRPLAVSPVNQSFEWETYLDENFLHNDRTIWIALEVSRSGIAPELHRWLNANADWVTEQKSGRLDRRERAFSLWRKPPVQDAERTPRVASGYNEPVN